MDPDREKNPNYLGRKTVLKGNQKCRSSIFMTSGYRSTFIKSFLRQ